MLFNYLVFNSEITILNGKVTIGCLFQTLYLHNYSLWIFFYDSSHIENFGGLGFGLLVRVSYFRTLLFFPKTPPHGSWEDSDLIHFKISACGRTKTLSTLKSKKQILKIRP